jgi:predicted nucleic acid-binding protein
VSRIIIDTNVLWDPAAMARLATRPEPCILPVVALAERARQYAKAGRSLESFWSLLLRAGVAVESLDEVTALRRCLGVTDDRDWARLARDAFIAGHVGPGDILWTRDVADFVAVGLPRDQIQDTAEFGDNPPGLAGKP